VLWAGHGTLPGTDGWVSLHLADTAHLTLPDRSPDLETTPLHDAVLEALEGGGAYFFRQLAGVVGAGDDKALEAVLWDLVWAGRISNDTLAPVRALTAGGHTAHRARRSAPRTRLASRPRRADLPTRSGPPTTAGRWSLLPDLEQDTTRRAHASAEGLLERHGVVTRGAVTSERVPGGFAGVYKVLSAFEESGRCRRGYFVGSLGAAQFGAPGAVDRLRSFSRELSVPGDISRDGPGDGSGDKQRALALAATDPANPYGAALPWPSADPSLIQPDSRRVGQQVTGHRPGRKAGALVVLVDGDLTVYVERGGRTVLTFTDDPDVLSPAIGALATAVRQGALGRLTVERADGENILGTGERPSALRQSLQDAGFVATPRGLRLRA
jgi:ATP-dependent Lhr-like helicase